MLHFLFDTLWRYAQKNPEDVWKIFETVIVDTPIFKENATDSRYEECSGRVLDSFQFVHHNLASHIRASSSALMASQVSHFVAFCLRKHIWPVYDVFYQQQCLKFLTKQSVSSWSEPLFRAYVIGIATAIHPSRDDPEENQMISKAIGCLHEPENLFSVCSTLAMYTPCDQDPRIPDIMTALAKLRPLDPAWDPCRQRLRELAEAQSFPVVTVFGEPDIEGHRRNIRKAIKTLDKFFSDIPPQATASFELLGPPLQPRSRLDRLLPWRRRRQQDEEHQLTERV
ncbi:hypothetical protein EDD18DRAFT_1462593 [Armillaria luteobubalina]|uniref:Uncharacterized protein n=1 Tax=Armillaria luteobubalina TaxID=153913 RepID=A0AA39Q606_9AGAR|nr:hypothetical protein EDD18DRAFT_1462593 [Armillaria luteobubalina]